MKKGSQRAGDRVGPEERGADPFGGASLLKAILTDKKIPVTDST